MSGHLCRQHHVDNGLPQRPEPVPARGEGDSLEYLSFIHNNATFREGGRTFQCFWRCCSCRRAQWAGRRGRRGGSPARPCRCTGWPAHSQRCTGRSWFSLGGPRRALWLLSERLPHLAGPDCSEDEQRQSDAISTRLRDSAIYSKYLLPTQHISPLTLTLSVRRK